MDTRIRGIDPNTWELFKQYCMEQSVKRKKNISANAMLKEMIDMVVSQNVKVK